MSGTEGFNNVMLKSKQQLPELMRLYEERTGVELDEDGQREIYALLMMAFVKGVGAAEAEMAASLIEQGLKVDVTPRRPTDDELGRYVPDELR